MYERHYSLSQRVRETEKGGGCRLCQLPFGIQPFYSYNHYNHINSTNDFETCPVYIKSTRTQHPDLLAR